ncbi:DNA methyltransferase [Pseudomonas monsensis]
MPTKNPKLKSSNAPKLFKYYAGFAVDFVESAVHKTLSDMEICNKIVVLDPWNGSGTTTNTCSKLGIPSIGIDRNPVMAVVAKAREARNRNFEYLNLLCEELATPPAKDDPLLAWIAPSGVAILRSIEKKIRNLSTEQDRSLGYVILFNLTKNLLKKYVSSNPTWIKKPETRSRIRPTKQSIKLELENCIKRAQSDEYLHSQATSTIITADSRFLPLKDNVVDLIITSPPYCTRIDYAIATSIELAVLSCSEAEFLSLRNELIGSTLVENGISQTNEWGSLCCETLNKIRAHPSKASNGYYIKSFLRYFDSLYKSIIEISRVTKNGGICYIVVQDSYYKEIFIDLAAITTDMFMTNKWSLVEQNDFIATRNKAAINTKSNKYQSNKIATESVLILRRES